MEYQIFKGNSLEEILSDVNSKLKEPYIYKEINNSTIYVYKLTDLSNYASKFLKELLTNMKLEVTIEEKINDNQITLSMNSNNNAILIGKNAKTLLALQNILRKHIYETIGINVNILLNVDNYQEKRKESLINLAKHLAKEVTKTKREVELDNMNSYERLIIHNTLKDDNNVITTSVGTEPNRHVVIKPKSEE